MRPGDSSPCRSLRKCKMQGVQSRAFPGGERIPPSRKDADRDGSGSVGLHAAAAIRLLMLTGCRKTEIVALRWHQVDLEAGELHLEDVKTGSRSAPLSTAVRHLLLDLSRKRATPGSFRATIEAGTCPTCNPPGTASTSVPGSKTYASTTSAFASRALAHGESLPMTGRLLEEAQVETTACDAHLARDSLYDAASRIADTISADTSRYRALGGGLSRQSESAVRTTLRGQPNQEDTPRP